MRAGRNPWVLPDVPRVMQKLRLVVLMAVVLLLAACDASGISVTEGSDSGTASGSAGQASSPVADAGATGALEAVQELECCYIEGSLSNVRLQTSDGQVVAENEFGAGPLIQPALKVTALPTGSYVLESWQRPCEAACPPQGGLDPETDRCEAELDVAAEERLEVLIEVTPGEGCTITVGGGLTQTTGDGAVHALDIGTGEVQWRAAVGGTMVELVAVGDRHAYVVTTGERDALHAVDIDSGEVAWRHDTAAWWPPGGAVVTGGTLYATVWDGTTVALDASTGEERWRASTAGESPKAPAVTGDVVVVGTDTQGHLYGLDAKTGAQQWHRQLAGGIPAAPTVDGDDVYVTAYGGTDSGQLLALDATSGTTVWEATLPGSVLGGAAVGHGSVYAGSGSIASRSGTLQAFETDGGSPRWSVITDGSVYSTPVVTDGRVLAADVKDDGSASLYAVGATTGEIEWTAALPAEVRGLPIVRDGRVHVTAHPAHLLVLDLESGVVLRRVDTADLDGDVDDLTAPGLSEGMIVVGSS